MNTQSLSAVGELPLQPTGTATMITQRAKRVPLHKRRRKAALAAAAVITVLVIATWIANSDSRPASPLGTSALQRSSAVEQQVPFVPAKRVLASSTSEQQVPFVPAKRVLANSASKPQTARRRVRIGDNQVEYIGDDVTVHYFTPKQPAAAPQAPQIQDELEKVFDETPELVRKIVYKAAIKAAKGDHKFFCEIRDMLDGKLHAPLPEAEVDSMSVTVNIEAARKKLFGDDE